MISVVLIGQNEQETLAKGLSNLVAVEALIDEIIFVDSDSSDGSVETVMSWAERFHEKLKIFRISGEINSAIARNVGIRHLKEDARFVLFLDADVEVNPEFVSDAIAHLEGDGAIGSVSGQVVDLDKSTQIGEVRKTHTTDSVMQKHGGIFMTRKSVVDEVGLFDERLIRHQDLDYSLRIRDEGYILKQSRFQVGTHNTHSYLSRGRVSDFIRNRRNEATGIFFRKYLFSKYRREMFGSVRGIFLRMILVICLFMGIALQSVTLLTLAALMTLSIVWRVNANKGETRLSRLYSILLGVNMLIGLFRTDSKKEYRIERIN